MVPWKLFYQKNQENHRSIVRLLDFNSSYLVYSQIAEFNAKQYILQLVKDISNSLIFSDHDSINYLSIEIVD